MESKGLAQSEYNKIHILFVASSIIIPIVTVVSIYLDNHASSAAFIFIAVASIGLYLIVVVVVGIALVVRILRGAIRRAIPVLISLLILASTPLWGGQIYTLIDVLRFFYSYDFYLAKVRETAPDSSGNKLVVFDWGSGGVVTSSRINSLVYIDGPNRALPSAPSQCASQQIHISGGFYSIRIIC